MKKLIFLIVASILTSSFALGYDKLSFDLSVNPGFYSFSHSTSDDTDSEFSVRYSLGGYYRFKENYRAGLNLSYFYDHFSGNEDVIHEDVSMFDMAALFQLRAQQVRFIDLWIGGGLAYGVSDYTDRYTVTSSNYVDDTLEDSTGIGDFGYQLQLDGVYHLPQNWPLDLGASVVYRAPFDNGANVFSVGFKLILKKPVSKQSPATSKQEKAPKAEKEKKAAKAEAKPTEPKQTEEPVADKTANSTAAQAEPKQAEEPVADKAANSTATQVAPETTASATQVPEQTAAKTEETPPEDAKAEVVDKKAERLRWKNAVEIFAEQIYP